MPSMEGTPAVMPIPVCLNAGSRMFARWGAEFIQLATVAIGVESDPAPAAMFSPRSSTPATVANPAATTRLRGSAPDGAV